MLPSFRREGIAVAGGGSVVSDKGAPIQEGSAERASRRPHSIEGEREWCVEMEMEMKEGKAMQTAAMRRTSVQVKKVYKFIWWCPQIISCKTEIG